jgi:hypothetical protein
MERSSSQEAPTAAKAKQKRAGQQVGWGVGSRSRSVAMFALVYLGGSAVTFCNRRSCCRTCGSGRCSSGDNKQASIRQQGLASRCWGSTGQLRTSACASTSICHSMHALLVCPTSCMVSGEVHLTWL